MKIATLVFLMLFGFHANKNQFVTADSGEQATVIQSGNTQFVTTSSGEQATIINSGLDCRMSGK